MNAKEGITAAAVPASHPMAAQVEQMLAELQATLIDCDVGPLRAMVDSDGSMTVFSLAGEPFIAGHRLVGLPAVMVRVDRQAKSTGPKIIFDTRPRPTKPAPRRTAIGVDIPDETADAMLDLCERERRYQAAYKVADFDGDEDEDAWKAANDAEAGTRLCADPPPITTEAGLRAAIRYVAEDDGFVQAPHARILARALEYLDGRA